MRKLATTLLLAALPLTASATDLFENWKATGGAPSDALQATAVYDAQYFNAGNLSSSVEFWYVGSYADYNLTVSVQSVNTTDGSWYTLFNNRTTTKGTRDYVGIIDNENPWTGGEFVFKLDVNGGAGGGGQTYYSYTYNNDSIAHTVSIDNYTYKGMTGFLIGFEDMPAGGHIDYDDMLIFVNGSGAIMKAVPEPETYAMLLAGLGLIGVVARRRKV